MPRGRFHCQNLDRVRHKRRERRHGNFKPSTPPPKKNIKKKRKSLANMIFWGGNFSPFASLWITRKMLPSSLISRYLLAHLHHHLLLRRRRRPLNLHPLLHPPHPHHPLLLLLLHRPQHRQVRTPPQHKLFHYSY
jgi:hypothetical protein